MWNHLRNRFLYKNSFIFEPVNRIPGSYNFECAQSAVDEFFNGEFLEYERHKLCKTYELYLKPKKSDNKPIGFVSYCNDSIRFKNVPEEKIFIPEAQKKENLPAVKIVWLGINKNIQREGLGTILLNITKLLFVSEENRTGCRVITVDAKNDPKTIGFYLKNGFLFTNSSNTPTENKRRNHYPMFFDLGGSWDCNISDLIPILPDGTKLLL